MYFQYSFSAAACLQIATIGIHSFLKCKEEFKEVNLVETNLALAGICKIMRHLLYVHIEGNTTLVNLVFYVFCLIY
jgi:hypothetical protein